MGCVDFERTHPMAICKRRKPVAYNNTPDMYARTLREKISTKALNIL